MNPDEIIRKVAVYATEERPIYLVGGSLRDRILGRECHDLDFVLPGKTRQLANQVAADLQAALYVLDEERDTTRVVLIEGEERMVLDFASLRAQTLESDLRARDFSMNAIAEDLRQPGQLIDPCEGLADLAARRIRACSPNSLNYDPARVLRLTRMAVGFGFQIEAETLRWAKAAAPLLGKVSSERQRDELFKMLDGAQVSQAVSLMDELGALSEVLPEMEALKGVQQSPPHVLPVWEHTLDVVRHLEMLYALLSGKPAEKDTPGAQLKAVEECMGRYRENFQRHFSADLSVDRTPKGLLFLAALYHDIAKPLTRKVEADDRVHFLTHESLGAQMAAARARTLALANDEVERVERIVAGHMRVHHLAAVGKYPSPRAIYRYFRDTGEAGVDICVLSLADTWGTYGETLPEDTWATELGVCKALLEARWEKAETIVNPPRLVDGHTLMKELGIQPGPRLGKALEVIREAQAGGEVTNRSEAIEYAKAWLDENGE
jgi:putative nucleotidyltransferase with HDIG domain